MTRESVSENFNLCIAYPNKFSYSETFIRAHLDRLPSNHKIYEGWYPAYENEGLSILRFPFNLLFIRGALRNITPVFYHKIYTAIFVKYLKRNNINILLAEYGPMGSTLMDACRIADIPFIVHFHGFDAYHYPSLEKFKEAYSLMFKAAAKIIVVSNDMKQQLINLGAEASKIINNPYGVNIEKFHGADPASSAPHFIAVGRFTEKKAPYYTIEAFAKVVKACSDAKLIMIGDGELFNSCKEFALKLNLSGFIEFRGAQSPDYIAKELRTARAFVQHSQRAENGDSEGTPNTILEASATGLPIISTLHAGIKDAVLHGETGYLVPEGDVDGMADYMIKLANDPKLAATMGLKGQEHMKKNFLMKDRIERLKSILLEAAKK